MKIVYLIITFFLFACSEPSVNEEQSSSPVLPEVIETDTKPVPVESCDLVLGFDAWEPYQYVDVGGLVTGLDIELVTGVAEAIGCKVSYKQGTWVELLSGLQEGSVDMLLGASKTPAREAFAYFSDPYRTEEFSLYIRKDDESFQDYGSLTEFTQNGGRIGIVSDYVYGDEVRDLLDDPMQSQGFYNAIMGEINIARLLDEDIDGFLEDSFVGATMLRRKALSDFIMAQGITINTGDAFVMFSQQAITQEQLAMFNAQLQRVKQSQTYQDLLSKYAY